MIRKQTLDNGLTLLTESMPQEAARVNGISHFIEHLVFKGTENRTAREISLAMDSVGGQIDAFTSKEYTCFYAKVLDVHLEETVDLLADIVQRPLFDADEIERERQVVLEEIKMVDDTPDDLIYDLFSRESYPRHTLGRPIQGTRESVSSLSRRQLLNFFRRAYRPENMIIAAAGNLKHAKLARVIRKAFGGLEPGPASNRRMSRPRFKCGTITRARNELEQLHLLIGLPAYREDVAERYALHVSNTILGGTMSSRLFQSIREERGLAYSVYSALNGFLDSGFMVVYAATRPDRGSEVIRLALEEMRSLREQGPTSDELEVAREHLKGSLMLSLESTSSRMSNLARQEIYLGRQQGLEETLAGVAAVTREQVHQLCREVMRPGRVALAAVGRVKRLKIGREGVAL